VVVSSPIVVVDAPVVVLPSLSEPWAADGNSRTKRYVNATIARTTRGSIHRPGLGS
jgi:hypothetical protein